MHYNEKIIYINTISQKYANDNYKTKNLQPMVNNKHLKSFMDIQKK